MDTLEAILTSQEPPAKITHLLDSMRHYLGKCKREKFVIFSQFTSYLKLVRNALSKEIQEPGSGLPIQIYQLDGTMTSKKRVAALSEFRNHDGPCAFLISLKAGGTGLNLTSARIAYMMDLWWNPATEDQAMDRIHRIGQTRDVKVIRYATRDSVEKRILEVQEGKEVFSKATLQHVGEDEFRKARLKLLKRIFDID